MRQTRKKKSSRKKGGTNKYDARMRIFIKNILNEAISYLLGGKDDNDQVKQSPYYRLLIYSDCYEPILDNLTDYILKNNNINNMLKYEYDKLDDKTRWKGYYISRIINNILKTAGFPENNDIIRNIHKYDKDIKELFSLDSESNTAKFGLFGPLSKHSVDLGTIMDLSERLNLSEHNIEYKDPKMYYQKFILPPSPPINLLPPPPPPINLLPPPPPNIK